MSSYLVSRTWGDHWVKGGFCSKNKKCTKIFKILQSKINELGKTFPACSATADMLKGQYGEWGDG